MQLKNNYREMVDILILQVLGVFIILCCAINASAWTDEQNLFTNNESCEFNVNPIFNSSTVDNPYWMDYNRYVHNPGNGILDPSLRSNDQVDLSFSYDICKYVYNPSTSAYVKSACCITISEVVTMEYRVDASGEGYYAAPDSLMTKDLTDAKLIQRYYQDMVNAGHIDCSEYTNIDEAGDGKPDVFGVEASADVGNDQLNHVYTGFVALTGDDEREVMAGQEYGFDMGSISGDGGSGDLANTIGWGKMDEGSKGSKNNFEVFFYTLIPIIFILLVMKMLGRVSN